jgi:prepilin-type N-terminal cleavage/methylation domain-containing protein
MPPLHPPKKRQGFTLIELILVIFIVGLIYAVGFSKFEITSSKPKALSPLNLKEVLQGSKLFRDQITLLCVNECKSCLLREGIHGAFAPYESGIDLTNIKAYIIDREDSLLALRYERYDDQPICLKFDIYPNGSSTQLILEDEKRSYFLPSYFDAPQAFDTLDDAKEYWLERTKMVSNQGDFY